VYLQQYIEENGNQLFKSKQQYRIV